MSLLSTSNSNPPAPTGTAKRLRRSLLAILMGLLMLEIGVRLPPVHAALSSTLDPYETLLWYSKNMLSYRMDFDSGKHYDLWLLGSSYMMTGLDPEIVGDTLAAADDPLTVQNYGFTGMINLADMALVVDRWLLNADKPRYAIIGLQWSNMSSDVKRPIRARSSPMERMLIFRDAPDDWVSAFVYQNSVLFRFATLARNALLIPLEQTDVPDLPKGGYVPRNQAMTCDRSLWTDNDKPTAAEFESHLVRLGALINMLHRNGVEVGVVNIPSSYCALRRSYSSQEHYEQFYLDPLAAYLQATGVPYAELDRRFFAAYPDVDEQVTFYYNASHPNSEGAKLFSLWTGEFAAQALVSVSR
jgi:hypothetical protein